MGLGSFKDIYKELSILDPFYLVKGLSGRAAPLKYFTSLSFYFFEKTKLKLLYGLTSDSFFKSHYG